VISITVKSMMLELVGKSSSRYAIFLVIVEQLDLRHPPFL